jgi:SRSO17 transposase
MRSLAATAGYKATGQETRESFKKPFQCARGTKLILHTRRHARTTLKWLFGLTFSARTKPEMALAEIDRVIAAGVRFGCVLANAGYGLSAPFRQGLTARKRAWVPCQGADDLAGCWARPSP